MPAHLEVYDHCKNEDGGDEVHEIWQVLPVEGLSEGAHLICACGQQVKQGNDGSLKLSAWKNHSNKIFFLASQRNEASDSVKSSLLPASVPLPVLTVVGLKAFHTIVSQMLVAMKREIPEPRP